jgi:Icc-related predicted phosphoesterase
MVSGGDNMPEREKRLRVAALADLHYSLQSPTLRPLLGQVAEAADVLLLCGDLTDRGLPEEAGALVRELSAARVPLIGVLGNHDFEAGQPDEVRRLLLDAGVQMLDGDVACVDDVGFAGVKGFAGGFGRWALASWGERMIKLFVEEAWNETLKLESALVRLDTETRVVLLHYSPIQATVEGEPPEIFPFLGSSHLEEPINRHAVAAVFHGHAHHGRPEAKTQTGIPVFNVSVRVLAKAFPDRPTFHVLTV